MIVEAFDSVSLLLKARMDFAAFQGKRALKEATVPLDGEHYLYWIAEQLDAGTPEIEIIEELRRFTKSRYTTQRLKSHIKDARPLMRKRH